MINFIFQSTPLQASSFLSIFIIAIRSKYVNHVPRQIQSTFFVDYAIFISLDKTPQRDIEDNHPFESGLFLCTFHSLPNYFPEILETTIYIMHNKTRQAERAERAFLVIRAGFGFWGMSILHNLLE